MTHGAGAGNVGWTHASPLRYTGGTGPYPTGEDVVEAGTEPVRVWIPAPPSTGPSGILVLGNSQTPEIELDLEAAHADGVPVYQRKGGGGAVHLTDGCVCVALRFRKNPAWGIADYFAAGNGLAQSAFRRAYGIRLDPRGISDLAFVEERHGRWEERKVAGSSLYMPRGCAVYLASILVDARLDALDRYLRHPSREPDYRGQRAHADFVTNLSGLPGLRAAGITPTLVRDLLLREAAMPDFRATLDL
jgi:lipoate-protein ligase A